MKHIVSFSGGMGSFAEAKACVDKFGKKNVREMTMDEKTDFENTQLSFLRINKIEISRNPSFFWRSSY